MAGDAGGKEVGRISIRVLPDTSDFRKVLGAELAAIEKELSATIGVNVDLDTLKARGDMASLMAKLKADAAAGVTAQVGVDFDPAKTLAKMKALKAALKAEGIEGITLHVDVERSNLDRIQGQFAKLGNGVRDAFTKATDGIWDGAGGATSGVGGLGRVLGIVAAVAALAAPALALISGVLTAMPAVIAGVLVPIAAIALGLDGIKEAAKVVEPEFKHLKDTMSAKFKDTFTPVFEKLKAIFPTLEQSMPGVATALGNVADSFVSVITSDKGLDNIKGIITNISDTITASAPGIGKMTDGLLGLAKGVSAKFPAVGQWLDKVGDSFDKWVTKVSSPGVGGGVGGKSPLDTAMENLGGTLKGVLDIIGDLAKQGFDWLSDPKFGDTMKTFVSDCKDLINNVLPGMKQFFEDIAGALHGIVTDIDKIKTWKPDIPGVSAPTEKQTAGKDTTNPFEPFTSDDAPWRKIKDEITTSFSGTVSLVKVMFDQLWNDIQTSGSVVWNVISGAATTAWQTVLNIAETTWNSIVATAGTVGARIGAALANIPGIVSSAWSTLSGVAQIAWNAVVLIVQSKAQEMVTAVQTKAGEIVSEIATWPGRFVAALGDVGGLLVDAGANLVQGLINGIKNKIGEAVAAAADLAGRVAAAAKGALGIHSPSTVFYDIGDNTMQGLLNGIDENGQNVIEKAKSLAEQISEAMANGMQGIAPSMKDQLDQTKDQLDLQQKNLQILSKGTDDKGSKAALQDQISQISELKKQLDPKSFGTGTMDQLNQTLDQLELQRKQLKVDLNAVPKDDKEGRKNLQSQIDQLQSQKDQLNLQKDQLDYSQQYGDSLQTNDTTMSDSLNKIVTAGKGFAESNIRQFTQDIGISGNGALSQAADQGLQFGMSALSNMIGSAFGGGGTTINVGSVDDAMAAKQTLANKKALQYTGR